MKKDIEVLNPNPTKISGQDSILNYIGCNSAKAQAATK